MVGGMLWHIYIYTHEGDMEGTVQEQTWTVERRWVSKGPYVQTE